MWPTVAVGDFFRLWFVGRMFGQRVMNTFEYQATARTGTGVSAPDLMAAFLADVEFVDLKAAFNAVYPPQFLWEAVWWQYDQANGPVYAKQIVADASTGEGNEARTANLQASVTRRGNLAERLGVGGLRIPIGTADLDIATGLVTADLKQRLTAIAGHVANPIEVAVDANNTYTLTPCITHQVTGVGRVAVLVTQAFPHDQARVLRRRTVGLGE